MTREFDDAVERARGHLRNATIEGLEAARAVLDAAQAAAGATGSAPDSLPGRIRGSLEELIEALRSGRRIALPASLVRPLSEALDSEIARWRARSHSDPDARLVLRAFLGLRELLWEMGLERDAKDDPPAPQAERASPSRAADEKRRGPRVQRFRVEN